MKLINRITSVGISRQPTFKISNIQPRRCFRATPPNRILGECFQQTHSLILGFHSATGLPWVLVLPLTGLCVRVFILSPFVLFSHKYACRTKLVKSLRNAWKFQSERKILEKHADLGAKVCKQLVLREWNKKNKEWRARLGITMWKGLVSSVQFPIFLMIIETIRVMCGTHAGMLSLLNWSSNDSTVNIDSVERIAIPLEHSLATEGALWFPNLLVPDPCLVLPFVLSACLFASISHHYRHSEPLNKANRIVKNFLKFMALICGPCTLQLPSAMLVYWISTSLVALGQGAILNWWMPLPRSVSTCKPYHERQKLGVTPQT